MNGNEQDLLWEQLQSAEIVSGERPSSDDIESPWYIRTLLGLSGWIAALFLLGFVAVGMRFIIESETASIGLGLIALTAAFFVLQLTRSDFYQQFGLAVSFAGQALLIFGLASLYNWQQAGLWWMVASVQLIIALVMPNFIQRVVAAWLSLYALSLALTYHHAPAVASLLATLVVSLIWLREFSWSRWSRIVRPIGYGATLALVQLKGQLFFGSSLRLFDQWQDNFQPLIPQWVAEFAIGIVLVAAVARLMKQSGESWVSRRMLVGLLVTLAIAAISPEIPGISAGLLVILLGFSNGNRTLLGLGIAALLFNISAYYYTLQSTLLIKSAILAATGAVLLLGRWVILKWAFPTPEGSHA